MNGDSNRKGWRISPRRVAIEASHVLLLLAVLAAVDWWRGREMLELPAPPLDGVTLSGEVVHAVAGEGVQLVYFWADWCPSCRFTSPAIDALVDDYPVMSVGAWSEPGDLSRVVEEKGYRFPVLVDADGINRERYGVTALPATFIVSDGLVVSATYGYTSEWGLRVRLWWASL